MRKDKPHPTVERWEDHLKTQGHREASNRQTRTQRQLFSFGLTSSKAPAPPETGPCPGLGHREDYRIPRYLSRTSVLSGGAPPRYKLLQQFKCARRSARKTPTRDQLNRKVLAAERAQALWLNQHTTVTVYSTRCTKEGTVSPHGDLLPCINCYGLLRVKTFRNSLWKKGATKNKDKYTPRSYRNPLAGKSYMRHEDVKEFCELVSYISVQMDYIATYMYGLLGQGEKSMVSIRTTHGGRPL